MTGEQLIRLSTQVAFVAMFVVVSARAVRYRNNASWKIAGFFGVIAALVVLQWVGAQSTGEQSRLRSVAEVALLLAFPNALLISASSFTSISRVLLGAAVVVFVGIVVLLPFVEPAGWVGVLLGIYFIGVQSYASLRFWRAAGAQRGVARRRLRMVALGSVALAGVVLFVLPAAVLPDWAAWFRSLSQLSGLAAGLLFFLGFVPPRVLLKAWQADALQSFYAETHAVDSLPGGDLAGLAQRVADVLGAPSAAIRLVARDSSGRGPVDLPSPEDEVFRTQQARLYTPERADDGDDWSRVQPVAISGPISHADRRYGVLTVEGESALVFADDDLSLVSMLARHIGLVLRNNELMEDAAEVRARVTTMRLKDEFLDAVAHDLQTPLTTLLGQSQLLLRVVERGRLDGQLAVGLSHIHREAGRIDQLVRDLLDAASPEALTERSRFEDVDLLEVASEAGAELPHAVEAISDGGRPRVRGDIERLRQVMNELLANAIKYGAGQDVVVRVGTDPEAGQAFVEIEDGGIGIPEAERDVIFTRYGRATNSEQRRFTGLGVGLYLVRRIVAEHEGRIEIQSAFGSGTRFRVTLPLQPDGAGIHGAAAHSGG